MRGGYELSLQQSQQLVVTQELQQALAILQMTTLELKQHLEQALLQNPVLEELEVELAGDDLADEVPEWAEYFGDASDLGLPAQKDAQTHWEWRSDSLSLYEYLLAQLVFEDLSPSDERVARFVLGCLDDDGYLQGEIAELANGAGIALGDFQRMWEMVRTWEPAGVGATDLVDCLRLQLLRQGCTDKRLYYLIGHHLAELMAGKFRRVAQLLGCSLDEVQTAAQSIGRLNPRPGSTIVKGPVNYIVPDVTVEHVEREYVVMVHDHLLPRLGLNHHYLNLLKTSPDAATKQFLRNKVKQGMWLLRSVEQRKLTLYRVMVSVIAYQRDFFADGPAGLHPLTLQAIADELGIHESTVSRAIAGKYVSTPRGSYPISFFFPSTLAKGVSSESARTAMREIIAAEDASRPLSDGAISACLKERGIIISRRTVTKYRHALGIPSFQFRKRY